MLVLLMIVAMMGAVSALLPGASFTRARMMRSNAVPLELEGQLNPKNKWEVKFIFDGVEKTVEVSEGDSLLESAEKIFEDAPFSCRNGVCTTCAARITEGRENTKLAVHGLGEPQIEAGFVCSCQAFPVGPGVTVLLNQNDEVYETQYGQYENSYEMKFGNKKEGAKKNKLFGF